MSDQAQRPVKQRKLRGQQFLQEVPTAGDDHASSTTSSSSSEVLMPVRSLAPNINTVPVSNRARVSSDDEGNEEENRGDDKTTSSDSENSDEAISSEESSDEENSEEDGEHSHRSLRTAGFTTIPRQSDMRSRLQDFLPRLEQANAELELGGNMQERIIDEVSDEDEQYIEMDLGLGVLTEQDNDDADVRIPFNKGDQASDDEGYEVGLSSKKDVKKSTKRKIEELG